MARATTPPAARSSSARELGTVFPCARATARRGVSTWESGVPATPLVILDMLDYALGKSRGRDLGRIGHQARQIVRDAPRPDRAAEPARDRRGHVVPPQLFEHRVGDPVLHDQLSRFPFPLARFVLGDRLVPEALLRELIPPLAEPALGELHDVALVNERDRAATGAQRVLDGFGDQALGAEPGHRLDADGAPGADLGAEPLGEEPDHRIGFGAAGPVLDPGVHVLDVLAEDHHVEFLRLAHRAGYAF